MILLDPHENDYSEHNVVNGYVVVVILIALHGIFSCNLSQFPYNCLIPKILEEFRFDKDEGKHNGFLLHHFHQNALLALEKNAESRSAGKK